MGERIFWAEVADAFRVAAENPEEAGRQKAEIELWERSSESDFKDEEW